MNQNATKDSLFSKSNQQNCMTDTGQSVVILILSMKYTFVYRKNLECSFD